MKVLYNESLAKYTTMKIGGVAGNFYVPENSEELKEVIRKNKNNYYILSAGSNLLINDKKTFENVIFMRDVDGSIINYGEGRFYCGASVRIQKLIKSINEAGYGGIEYLNSIPAFIGGMIYMNAGIGNNSDCISTYLEKVYAVDVEGNKVIFEKEDCMFSHRKSIFQKSNYIILGADFKFPKQDYETSKKRIDERKKRSSQVLDTSGGNFGSVFLECDVRIMKLIRMLKIGYKKNGVVYSSKCLNYLINRGEGTYEQAFKLINMCIKIHKLLNKNIQVEVTIWE